MMALAEHDRAGEIRTHTRFPSADFKSAASTVPPLPQPLRFEV